MEFVIAKGNYGYDVALKLKFCYVFVSKIMELLKWCFNSVIIGNCSVFHPVCIKIVTFELHFHLGTV